MSYNMDQNFNGERYRQIQMNILQNHPKMQLDKVQTQQQIFTFLNQLQHEQSNSGSDFDVEIAQELFDRILGENKPLTLNNFIFVVVEAESVLNQKLQQQDQIINQIYGQQKQIESVLKEISTRQQRNYNNSTNKLVIEKIALRKIDQRMGQQGQQCEPFLMIILGTQTKETPSQFSQNPEFSINVNFAINSFQDDLQIQVLDRQRNDQYQQIQHGSTRISLDMLPFFQKQPCTFKLYLNEQLLNSELIITCYIDVGNYNEADQYLQDKLQEKKQYIDNLNEEKKQIQDQLDIIILPFELRQNNAYPQIQNDQQKSQPQNLFTSDILKSSENPNKFIQSNQIKNQIPQNTFPNNESYSMAQEQQFAHIQSNTLEEIENDSQLRVKPEQQEYQDNNNYNAYNNYNNQYIDPQYEQPMQQQQSMHYEQDQNNYIENDFEAQNNQINQQPIQEQKLNDSNQNLNNKPPPKKEEKPLQPQDAPKFEQEYEEVLKILSRADLFTLVYFLLALLVCFRRSTFIDMSIALAFLMMLMKKKFENNEDSFKLIKIFCGAVGFSIIYDIIWLSKYSSNWSENNSEDITEDRFLRMWSLVFSYFLIILKFVLIASYYIQIRYQESLTFIQLKFNELVESKFSKKPESKQPNIKL